MIHRLLSWILMILSAAVVLSCAPWPRRTGALAGQLPNSEVIQIRALVRARRDIKKPITKIEMVAPDQAKAEAGVANNTGDIVTLFTMHKKNGRWIIDESSIYESEVIITD